VLELDEESRTLLAEFRQEHAESTGS